jgi:hypothetical protein
VEGDAAVMMIDDDVGGAMIAIDARERFIAIIYIVYPVQLLQVNYIFRHVHLQHFESS